MSYDAELANRIRAQLAAVRDVSEMAMFGGLAFLIGGNMAVCAASDGRLMVRVPPDDTAALLLRSHVEPMVMAGRETRGWVRVAGEGVRTDRQLAGWVRRGVDYAGTLPSK